MGMILSTLVAKFSLPPPNCSLKDMSQAVDQRNLPNLSIDSYFRRLDRDLAYP
jgi:hypothetical protein